MLVVLACDGGVEESDIWLRRSRDENLLKGSQLSRELKIADIFWGISFDNWKIIM